MIIDLIVGILTGLLNAVLMLLPTWAPADWATMAGDLATVLSSANNLFPLSTLGACIGILMALHLFTYSWGAIVYVYRLIPFKAS